MKQQGGAAQRAAGRYLTPAEVETDPFSGLHCRRVAGGGTKESLVHVTLIHLES